MIHHSHWCWSSQKILLRLGCGEEWRSVHVFPSILQCSEFDFCSFLGNVNHERFVLSRHQNEAKEIR